MKLFLVFVVVLFLDLGFCRYYNRIQNGSPKHLSSIQYHTRSNQNITVSIMIHIDTVLTKNLYSEYGRKTRQKLKLISNEILQEVTSLYRPMNQKIHFKLIDTRFVKNNTKILRMDDNISNYLKSYCEWQAEKKKNKWYYSILLTGLNLFYQNEEGKEVRRSTGRGYMGGMCNYKKSCALLEWHPRNIGFQLAHEIGHSLGMSHDGPPNNQCKASGHIMAAKYNRKRHPKTWSQCSKIALKQYLVSDSEFSDCSRSSSPAPVPQQTQPKVKAVKSSGASRDSKRKQRSDSECSVGSRSSSPTPQKKKAGKLSVVSSKDKGKKSSRSEWEQERRAHSPTPVPIPTPATAPPKKESKASGSSKTSASKRKTSSSALKKSGSVDIFKIIREEEKLSKDSSKSTSTTSTFTSRVSSGQSRRTTVSTGDYFVDLKIYKIEDWEGSAGLERYKKALATVKLQCDEKSSQWDSIQQFLGQAFTVFENSEPVHFSNVKK